MDALRSDWEGALCRQIATCPIGWHYDDLSDVSGPLHQTECFRHLPSLEDAVGKGDQLALGKELHEFTEQAIS